MADYRGLPLPPCPHALAALAADRLTAFVRAVYGLSVDEADSLPPWIRMLLADAAVRADERHETPGAHG